MVHDAATASTTERFAGYALLRRMDSGGDVEFYETRALGDHDAPSRLLIRLPKDDLRWPPWADPSLATMLVHPNIVRLFQCGEIEGRPTAILEFVPGLDLRELLLVHGRLPPQLCWFVTSEVCRGLVAALDSRLPDDGTPLRWTHGRLCPRAVRISYDGAVKVGWFGIGRLKPERTLALGDGAIDERLPFVAPEEAAGTVCDPPCPAVDVFRVGALLHALLLSPAAIVAGRTSIEHLQALARYDGWTFSRVDRLVSPAMAGAIARMLAFNPTERFGDVGDVLETLSTVPEAGDPVALAQQLAAYVRADTA